MVDSDVVKALAEGAGRLSAAAVAEAVDIEGVRNGLLVRRLWRVWSLLQLGLLLLARRIRSRWEVEGAQAVTNRSILTVIVIDAVRLGTSRGIA